MLIEDESTVEDFKYKLHNKKIPTTNWWNSSKIIYFLFSSMV